MALLSIPLWLIFEAYNLRLQNWTYVGVPRAWPAALLGYGWSFATITPAMFETSDLVQAGSPHHRPRRCRARTHAGIANHSSPRRSHPDARRRSLLAHSAARVPGTSPLIFSRSSGSASCCSSIHSITSSGFPHFSAIWPKACRGAFTDSCLPAGFAAGSGNSGTTGRHAKWQYIFPMFQQWKIFEMPAPGFLGFLPFALDCFVMYVTAAWLLGWVKRVT